MKSTNPTATSTSVKRSATVAALNLNLTDLSQSLPSSDLKPATSST